MRRQIPFTFKTQMRAQIKCNKGSNYRIQGHTGLAQAKWLESFVERDR